MRNKFLRSFILIGLTGVLSGCCFINFADDVLELGDRYKAKILAFYDQHERYPDYDEDQQLIVELGCELKSRLDQSYICDWIEYEIQAGYGGILANGSGLPSEEVHIKIIRSSTICQYRFQKNKDGELIANETKCRETDCIRWRQ